MTTLKLMLEQIQIVKLFGLRKMKWLHYLMLIVQELLGTLVTYIALIQHMRKKHKFKLKEKETIIKLIMNFLSENNLKMG